MKEKFLEFILWAVLLKDYTFRETERLEYLNWMHVVNKAGNLHEST